MSYIAEWSHGLHVLEHTFEAVPDLELSLEDVQPSAREEESINAFFHWASCGDFDAFEAAIAADPHCESAALLTELGDRRLYRLTPSEAGEGVVLYPAASASDIVILDSTLTRDGVESRVRLPSREALLEFRRTFDERPVPFSLDRLYEERVDAPEYDVTEPQREALLEALEGGYFAVPRRTTLRDLATELDVSAQALSARLRRGQANLLRRTLASGVASI